MVNSEIYADLTAQFEQQAKAGEYDNQLTVFMGQVVAVWKDYSPVGGTDDPHPGLYRDSVRITKPAAGGKGQVGATVDYAHIIEYGSEDTPEFAPRAKTEAHFNRS